MNFQKLSRAAFATMFVALLFVLVLPIIQFACGDGINFDLGLVGPACHEHEVSTLPHADADVFNAVIPNRVGFDFVVALAVVGFFFAFKPTLDRRLAPAILQRMKFLRWLWAKSRPFLSSKNFLPYFAPMRDA